MRFRKLLVPLRNLVLIEHYILVPTDPYLGPLSALNPKSYNPTAQTLDRGSNNTYTLHTRKPKTLDLCPKLEAVCATLTCLSH